VIVTVTPNPSIDLTLELAELRRGTVHRATGRHVEPSGKGVNVTRALAANGLASLAVLPVGGSEGLELADLLRALAGAADPVVALGRLCAVGHSSGAALAWGVLLALDPTRAPQDARC